MFGIGTFISDIFRGVGSVLGNIPPILESVGNAFSKMQFSYTRSPFGGSLQIGGYQPQQYQSGSQAQDTLARYIPLIVVGFFAIILIVLLKR